MTTRRGFGADFKAKVALEALRGITVHLERGGGEFKLHPQRAARGEPKPLTSYDSININYWSSGAISHRKRRGRAIEREVRREQPRTRCVINSDAILFDSRRVVPNEKQIFI